MRCISKIFQYYIHCTTSIIHPLLLPFWSHLLSTTSAYQFNVKRMLHRLLNPACPVCAQIKFPWRLRSGVLEPWPILNRPWSYITIDLITDLTSSQVFTTSHVACSTMYSRHMVLSGYFLFIYFLIQTLQQGLHLTGDCYTVDTVEPSIHRSSVR